MIMCVCVDESMGMSFNRRRQSRDKKLTERLLSICAERKLYISDYSRPLFEGFAADNIIVSQNFSEAGSADICFFELENVSEYAARADGIIMYRWNRKYPSDKKFPFVPSDKGYVLESSIDFSGNSHEKITEEVWVRK